MLLETWNGRNEEWEVGAWLAGQAFGPRQERLQHVRIFPRADGGAATPADLRRLYARDGYLGISAQKFAPGSSWRASDVLVHGSALQAVTDLPHRMAVSGLRDVPRLPKEQSYLTRIPLLTGELGLCLGPHGGRLRRCDREGKWIVDQASPTSVDVAGGFEPVAPALPDLYRALYHQEYRPEHASLIACYMLDGLVAGQGEYLKEKLQIPVRRGEPRSFAQAVTDRFYCDESGPLVDPPDDALVLSERAGQVLQALAPGPLRSYREFLKFTRLAEVALHECTSASVLVNRLWEMPLSQAGQWLHRLPRGQRPKIASLRWSHIRDLAREMAHRSWIGVVSTDHLLRAVLETMRSPLPREELVAQRGLELMRELDVEHSARPWPQLHLLRARVHLSRGELEAAEEECHALTRLASHNPQGWYLLANVHDLRGEVEQALQALERMRTRARDELMKGACDGMLAEVLVRAGRLFEVESYVDTAFTAPGQETSRRALLARVALAQRQPVLALGHLDAILGQAPPEAFETRALALQAVGRMRESVEAFGRFLEEARVFGLFSTDAEERLARARRVTSL